MQRIGLTTPRNQDAGDRCARACNAKHVLARARRDAAQTSQRSLHDDGRSGAKCAERVRQHDPGDAEHGSHRARGAPLQRSVRDQLAVRAEPRILSHRTLLAHAWCDDQRRRVGLVLAGRASAATPPGRSCYAMQATRRPWSASGTSSHCRPASITATSLPGHGTTPIATPPPTREQTPVSRSTTYRHQAACSNIATTPQLAAACAMPVPGAAQPVGTGAALRRRIYQRGDSAAASLRRAAGGHAAGSA